MRMQIARRDADVHREGSRWVFGPAAATRHRPTARSNSDPRMAHFAIPRYIAIRDAMPKTPSERVEKFKLKNEGITDDCWDREAEGVEFAR
jgi:acyl-CoA synthetase (AMP-forming)/AMP-acid ligase II